MKKILGCCLVVVSLCLCSCSLLSKGTSSGKIGFEDCEILTWEDKEHNVDVKVTSPLLEKVVSLLISEGP